MLKLIVLSFYVFNQILGPYCHILNNLCLLSELYFYLVLLGSGFPVSFSAIVYYWGFAFGTTLKTEHSACYVPRARGLKLCDELILFACGELHLGLLLWTITCLSLSFLFLVQAVIILHFPGAGVTKPLKNPKKNPIQIEKRQLL